MYVCMYVCMYVYIVTIVHLKLNHCSIIASTLTVHLITLGTLLTRIQVYYMRYAISRSRSGQCSGPCPGCTRPAYIHICHAAMHLYMCLPVQPRRYCCRAQSPGRRVPRAESAPSYSSGYRISISNLPSRVLLSRQDCPISRQQ